MDTIIESIVTGLLLGFSAATVILSVMVALLFRKYKTQLTGAPSKLSGSLALQLMSESILGLGILVFTVANYYGYSSKLGSLEQDLIKLVMFTISCWTTLKLWRTLQEIKNGRSSNLR